MNSWIVDSHLKSRRFKRNMRNISPAQCFVTSHDLDGGFGGAGACRECMLPRNDEDAVPIGWVRGHENCPGTGSQYHSYQYGIQVRVKTLKNCGSHSWIVISGGMNKYVVEPCEENGKSVYHKEMAAGMVTRCDKT